MHIWVWVERTGAFADHEIWLPASMGAIFKAFDLEFKGRMDLQRLMLRLDCYVHL